MRLSTPTSVLVVLFATACGAPTTHDATATTTAAAKPSATRSAANGYSGQHLANDLRALGSHVKTTPIKPRPPSPTGAKGNTCWLSGTPSALSVDDQDIKIFEYASEADAKAAASTVGCSGSRINACILEWNSYPHFYRKQNLIAFYLGGQKNELTSRLTSTLGVPFAGEQSVCHQKRIAEVRTAQQKIEAGNVGVITGKIKKGGASKFAHAPWVKVTTAGHQRLVQANERGDFEIRNLPAGDYKVSVEAVSFQAWVRDSVAVRKGDTQTLAVRVRR